MKVTEVESKQEATLVMKEIDTTMTESIANSRQIHKIAELTEEILGITVHFNVRFAAYVVVFYILGIFGACAAQPPDRNCGIPYSKSHLCQTMRRDKCLCCFFTSELHFCHDQRSEGGVKNIQLDSQGIVRRRCGEAFLESGML